MFDMVQGSAFMAQSNDISVPPKLLFLYPNNVGVTLMCFDHDLVLAKFITHA